MNLLPLQSGCYQLPLNPVRAVSQVTSVCGSRDAGPLVFRCMFWGVVTQVYVLKVGIPHVGLNTLLLREKFQVLCSFPVVGHCARGGLYCEIVFRLFYVLQCGFLFVCQVCSCHSANLSFKRKLFHCSHIQCVSRRR